MSLFGYEVQILLSEMMPVSQNLNHNLLKRLSVVLTNQQGHQSMYSDALVHAEVPYHIFHDYSTVYL